MDRATPTSSARTRIARRAFTTRQLGLALAAGTAIAGIAIVATLVMRSRSATPQPQQATQPQTAPNVRDLPRGDAPTLGSGDQFFIQFVDKSDPTRLGGEITAERSTPQPDGRYDLTQPIAWFFLDDGRSVQVTAREGSLVMPAGARSSTPDRGSLEGDVRVRLFAQTADGKRPDADATPLATIDTPRLTVDWTLGQLDMPDAVKVQSSLLQFEGRGVIAQFDATTKRLESLNVTQTTRAVYDPAARDLLAPSPARPAASAPQATATSSPSQPPPPVATSEDPAPDESPTLDLASQTLYAINMEGQVRISRDGQQIAGDRVEAWARTLDHRLPERTTLTANTSTPTRSPQAASAVAPPTTQPSTSPSATTSAQPSTPQQPATAITLAFTGPLDIRRIADAPQQLLRDDLLMRVLAEGDTDAGVLAPQQGITVTGRELEYAATRRLVSFASPAPALAALVASRDAERFSVEGNRIEANLATGIARVLSPGTLAQTVSNAPRARMTWSEQAQFDLLPPATPNGLPQSRLLAATMLGTVRGTLPEGTFAADSISASFAGPEIAPDSTSALQFLRLVGAASIIATPANPQPGQQADALAAASIAITFDPLTKQPTPTRLEAHGSVRGVTSGTTLTSESLVASLALNDNGSLDTRDFIAEGAVRVQTADGVIASAARLDARPTDKAATLTGSPASLVQAQSTLSAPSIALDGLASTVLATGAGTLTSREHNAQDANAQPRTITATWTDSFAYNDTSGLAKLTGDANVDVAQGPLAKDTTRAAIIEMSLAQRASAPADSQASGIGTAFVAPGGERDVLWILATGAPASVRSERFDPANTARRTRLISLTAPTIRADVPQQMLRASGAGQLVTADTTGADNTTGQALFTWKGYADFEQAAGIATMHDSVRAVYRANAAEQPTELEAQTLRATFAQREATASDSAQLKQVDATGGVWARNQGRELTAATLSYDPAASLLNAQGAGAVLVDIAGSGSEPPVSARQVRWNLTTNRVEVIEPAPTVVPR